MKEIISSSTERVGVRTNHQPENPGMSKLARIAAGALIAVTAVLNSSCYIAVAGGSTPGSTWRYRNVNGNKSLVLCDDDEDALGDKEDENCKNGTAEDFKQGGRNCVRCTPK